MKKHFKALFAIIVICTALWAFQGYIKAPPPEFSDLQDLESMASRSSKLKQIMDNPDSYPERLLEALSRNPELVDFALDYPTKLGTSSPTINLSSRYDDGQIPLLMQWDNDWGYASYGQGVIGLDGCGPTCLSMVVIGLTGDQSLNPKVLAEFAEENNYLDRKTDTTLWTLMSDGAEKLGLQSNELPLDENIMAQELSQGHPIICSMGQGDFTTTGHFIVLYEYRDGYFMVRDPNSKSRSKEKWSYESLNHQIENLWAYSK